MGPTTPTFIANSFSDLSLAHPPTSAQQIPHEILSTIFDLVSSSVSGHLLDFTLTPETALSPRPAARHAEVLRSMALVCRNWHVPATEVLFRNLSVVRPGQLPDLVKYSGRCLPLVRHLRVLWNRQPWILPQDPDLALIPKLLDMCPNVDRITLAGEQFDLASPALLNSLRSRSAPTSLASPIFRLSCCLIEVPFHHQRFGPQDRRTSETIGALLLACPDLEEGRWDEFRSAYSTIPHQNHQLHLAPKLQKLAFQRVALESSNLERLLCPLGGQLKELYLDRTSLATCESWRMVLGKVGETLEVLELKDCDFWAVWAVSQDSEPLVDATLTACPLLRHLVLLGSLDSAVPKFQGTHHFLESLTIGCRFIEPRSLADAIRRGAFPKLRKLHVEATSLSPNFSASSESLPILAHSTSTLHPPPPPPILRNRTQSTPTKPPTAVRLSSAYDGLETYGAGDEASGAETRSIRMGGERPLSATFREGATNKRYSGMSEGGETIASLGYLFLDDPRHAAASDERHLSGIGEQDNGFTPVVRDVRSTTRAMTGGQPARSHYGMFESGPSVPPFPGASGEEMRDSFDERGRRVLGKEEAWYFLRELVGQELKLEEGLLWKLSSLVAEDEEEDMFASPDQASDFLDAREAPILRYLIRHFLLTLPLIRDTTREGSTSSIPDFWTSGLHVLIRKVHDADLSHDVDTSSKSLASTLYSSVVRKSLERFVSAGLKLSRAHGGEEESAPRPGRDDLETEPPRNATPGPSQERDVSSSSPLARQPLQDILWNSPPPLQPNDLVPPPPPIP
ncbi:hypothetical protein P7C70_g6753, partial [Phenoliferia sp. Uapishka_3]